VSPDTFPERNFPGNLSPRDLQNDQAAWIFWTVLLPRRRPGRFIDPEHLPERMMAAGAANARFPSQQCEGRTATAL
jgi:hypothetical protein